MYDFKIYLNPILAREGQIGPTKPKTLNFCHKYNQFFKRAPGQYLNLPKDLKNAKTKILVLHWFGNFLDHLQLVGKICPSVAIYVILKPWSG